MDYPEYVALYFYITRGTYPADSTTILKKRLQRKARKFVAYKGKLYRKNEDDEEETNILGKELLHEGNILDIITRVHEEGHFGIKNTYTKVSLQYEGKGLYDITTKMVKSCLVCQKRQKVQKKKTIVMKPIPTPYRPFYMIGLDAVGPLETTKRKNKYLLVAIDYLTRWPIAAAVPDITAKTSEEFLHEYVFQYHGIPTYLLTDRGSSFKAEYLDYILKRLECRHLLTCAYRPQSNGMVERLNQTLVNTMAKLRQDDKVKNEWDTYVNKALFCIRTMVNEATKVTPAMLLYGYDLRTPATWPAPRYDYVEGEIEEEVERRSKLIQGNISKLREEAVERSMERKRKMKLKYDQEVKRTIQYKVGDMVLMKNHVPNDKWDCKYVGPFEVVKVNKNSTYHLVGPNSRKLDGAVNGNYLLPFQDAQKMVPVVKEKSKLFDAEVWLSKQ
jgi:hypothetical protein